MISKIPHRLFTQVIYCRFVLLCVIVHENYILLQEMHPDFHNIKIRGEMNFEKNMQELKSGVAFCDLSKIYVPKTLEEQAKVQARQQLTKEQLLRKLKSDVFEALSEFPVDDYLSDLSLKLEGKTSSSFKSKSDLVEISAELIEHLDNLVACKEFNMYIPDDNMNTNQIAS